MNQSKFKNKEFYFLSGLIVLVALLLAFKSRNTLLNSLSDSVFERTLSFNSSFEQLPESYEDFMVDNPIDIILDSTEGNFERIANLKFDAHMHQNGAYREIVLIKKASPNDTLLMPIRLDIYPTERKPGERKYITYTANSITYAYNGSNFHVARQVLPNIAINKIVPYTKSWQTAIPAIDNTMLSSKEEIQLRIKEKAKIDSSTIGLNPEASAYEFIFEKALQDNDISYLPATQNFKKETVLSGLQKFNDYQNEKGLQLIYIQNDISFWKGLTQFNEVPEFKLLGAQGKPIIPRLTAFTKGELKFEEAFDIEKLSAYYALLNLYSKRFENSLYLNFNKNTGLLEPFFVKKQLGELNTYLEYPQIQNIAFSKRYVEQLQRFSNLKETKVLIENHTKEIKQLLEAVHQNEPTSLFDKELFSHNKLIINKALNPSTTTKIVLLNKDDKQLEVEVENMTNFPIEIAELSYQRKKFISSPHEENHIVMPLQKQKVIFDLPDSFDNLFVHKKKKTTGFIFEKDIFNLAIGYRLTGTFDMKHNDIIPFKDLDVLVKEDDLFRKEEDLSDFDFISVDEEKREIRFTVDSIVLYEPLVFPSGYTINAYPGLTIDVLKGGKIISKSPLNFIGSEDKPIKIYSSDRNGQGVFVVSAKDTSELKYVEFDHLTNQAHGLWDLTGAVVFYESPVNLDHVLVANNSCEDGLNIIRTNFTMKNTRFLNTQSDAFDGDFVQGTLTNCSFENLGNDAVDVSGSTLEMYNLSITNAGDKALSAGEDSQMIAEGLIIDQSEIAIAGKDLSIVQVQDATITNSKLGFTAFQKKPEFGASDIEARNVVMKNVETAHLIENRSSLRLNGDEVETIEAVKEQMYGVEFGVDSKETRVKKTQ